MTILSQRPGDLVSDLHRRALLLVDILVIEMWTDHNASYTVTLSNTSTNMLVSVSSRWPLDARSRTLSAPSPRHRPEIRAYEVYPHAPATAQGVSQQRPGR